MAGDDQAVHEARASPRPLPQGLRSAGRVQPHDTGPEEFLKRAHRQPLRNTVVMPQGVKRLDNHEIGDNHILTKAHRTLDPPTGGLQLQPRLTDQQAKHDRGVKPDGHSPIP